MVSTICTIYITNQYDEKYILKDLYLLCHSKKPHIYAPAHKKLTYIFNMLCQTEKIDCKKSINNKTRGCKGTQISIASHM